MGGYGNVFLKAKQNTNLANVQNKGDDVYGIFSKKILNFELFFFKFLSNSFIRQILQEDEFEEPEGLEKGIVTKFIFRKLTRCEMGCSCFIIIAQICASVDVFIIIMGMTFIDI